MSYDDSGSERRSSLTRPGFMLAGGFVILLVLLLIVVLAVTADENEQSERAQPKPTLGKEPPPLPEQQPDEGPPTIPETPPTDVSWNLYHTVALPVSEKAGPRIVTDSIASDYAHTPTGALMAATQIPTRKLVASNWRAVLDQQVVAGPGKEAFAKARAQISATEPAPGEMGQISGYKFVNYTPDTATIQFVTRFISGEMQSTTTTMQWQDGDWKLVLQPDGSESPTSQSATSLSGYVPWGGI